MRFKVRVTSGIIAHKPPPRTNVRLFILSLYRGFFVVTYLPPRTNVHCRWDICSQFHARKKLLWKMFQIQRSSFSEKVRLLLAGDLLSQQLKSYAKVDKSR